MSTKISNDTNGNRTCDLPTCSAVPQPTAPPRHKHNYVTYFRESRLHSLCELNINLSYITMIHCSSFRRRGLEVLLLFIKPGPHCNVTAYRDSVDGTRDRVTYQKLVTRSRYGLVRRTVGILPSHQRDDTVRACADVDGQRDPPLLCPPFRSWCFCLEEGCESVVLCGFLSVLVIVKWSGLKKCHRINRTLQEKRNMGPKTPNAF